MIKNVIWNINIDMDEVSLTGWDFSGLTALGRMSETALPWDYRAIVKEKIPGISRMLDMGTGGGELLKTLTPLPAETYATEGYEPNVKIAEDNLSPLGVKVVSDYSDIALPFENNFFELVTNRHEYYVPAEVKRILKPGGTFITQQVKWDVDREIIELLGRKPEEAAEEYYGWSIEKALRELQDEGFKIVQSKDSPGFTYFTDIAALISYIKIINWLVPDFTPEKYSAELKKAEYIIEKEGRFSCTLNRFLITAEKF